MQKTAYEMRIRDWSSDVCSSDLVKHGSRLMNEAAGGDYRRMADLEPCQSWMGHCALEWSRAGGDRKMLGAFYRPADDWETPTDPWYRRLTAQIDAKRSEGHTSELQSLMRTSYDVFCLKKKNI